MAWGTQTTKPQEYFHLANHGFPNRGCPLSEWKVADTETDYPNGLIATAYVNQRSNNMVIAFRMIGENHLTQDKIQTLVEHAHDFASYAKSQAKELAYQVSYTGFGLGGSVAELCATKDNLPAFTFDTNAIANPGKNSQFFNLTRYMSNKDIETGNHFGNIFYIDLGPKADDALGQRFANAYDATTTPSSIRKHHHLNAWADILKNGYPENIKTMTLTKPDYDSQAEAKQPQAARDFLTVLGYNPYRDKHAEAFCAVRARNAQPEAEQQSSYTLRRGQ